MTRIITVLQDDIDNGKVGISYSCALALAAKRELMDMEGIYPSVSASTIYLYENEGRTGAASYVIRLPEEAREFVATFDARQPVEPFKFEAEIKEHK